MELPPVLDIEDCRAPKGSVLIPHIKACLQMLESEFGRKPIIYTARWYTEPWLGDCSWLKEYPFWIAQYTYNPSVKPTYLPRGITKYLFHQYSDNLEIPGIAENDEDGDTFNGSLEELYAFAGMKPPMSIEERVSRLEALHPEIGG
jgi:lysozyme